MLAAFSVTPVGAGDSLAGMVAEAVKVVRESGLPSETNALFTNVEGEWDDVMAVIRQCTQKMAEMAPRVSVMIKLDIHEGMAPGELSNRVQRVEQHIIAQRG